MQSESVRVQTCPGEEPLALEIVELWDRLLEVETRLVGASHFAVTGV